MNQPFSTISKYYRKFENSVALVTLFFVLIFPFSEMLIRIFNDKLGLSIPPISGAAHFLTHLVIWFTMLGAMISSREKEHISLAVIEHLIPDGKKKWIHFFTSTVAAVVLFAITHSSYLFVRDAFIDTDVLEMAVPRDTLKILVASLLVLIGCYKLHFPFLKKKIFSVIAIVAFGTLFYRFAPNFLFPHKIEIEIALKNAMVILPIGFLIMGLRSVKQESLPLTVVSLVVGVATPIITTLLFGEEGMIPTLWWWGAIALLTLATFLGTPVFVALSGFAALFFYNSNFGSIVSLPNGTYTVLNDEIFPTIPLFTIAGFILSESGSGKRLVRFFKVLFGPIPGGLAIMTILVCAFFTTFTGASGVTILALGGLLHFIMKKNGYEERFATGYLTASGSIGLLFPPSLPIILYGVQAQINIKHLFAGGILPGILMVAVLSVYAVMKEKKGKRTSFSWKRLIVTSRAVVFEIALPFVILLLFFSGLATIVETGAIAVVYLALTHVMVHKDFKFRELPKIVLKAVPIAGSVLIIIAAANGLKEYIVDAEVPMILADWVKNNIESKWVFLLILNVLLLVTGFFMDIFSATIVVVPLIIPISNHFGIHPVHLGIIFLANLELGYLTPPVGLNLFLSALRFKKPLVEVYRSVIPFLLIMIVAVLIITYIPALTLIGLKLFGFE